MKITQIIQETTTAGSVAPVEHSFVKMKTRNPSVYGDTKAGNLLKGKKTNKPFANSLNEGAVKQLTMDLKGGPDGLTDEEFKKKYGKTKAEVRAEMKKKPEPLSKVDEAKLDEEDKIIAVGKGSKLKTGLHGKDEQPKFRGYAPPFKSEGMHVSDKRGKSVCECGDHSMAPIIAKALNAYAIANESVEQGVAESIEDTRKQANLKKKIDKGTATPEQKKEYEALKARNMGKKQDVDEGAKVDRMVKHIEKSEKKLGKSNKEAENIAWATANKRGMLDNKNKKAK